jgi:hypothetical protein
MGYNNNSIVYAAFFNDSLIYMMRTWKYFTLTTIKWSVNIEQERKDVANVLDSQKLVYQ